MTRHRPLQLLEINLISAQDLALVTRSMRTYAIAWVHPQRKLSTRVDTTGHNNPTWNDKFVFRVDDEFLRADTSAVMIDIYAQHWFRDYHVGTVRILVGNLIPSPTRPGHRTQMGMRFLALQVRRSSGRPQGLLNIGVALLDSSMRSMPLYSQLSASAVGFHDLVGGDDPKKKHHNNNNSNNSNQTPTYEKMVLRRSKSERSDRLVSEAEFSDYPSLSINGSELSGARGRNKKRGKASSVISGSEVGVIRSKGKLKSRKASSVISESVISGSDFMDQLKKRSGGKAGPIVNVGYPAYPYPGIKCKEGGGGGGGGSGSVLSSSSSESGGPPTRKRKGKPRPVVNGSEEVGEPTATRGGKAGNKYIGYEYGSKPSPKESGLEFWGPGPGGPGKGGLRSFNFHHHEYGVPPSHRNITTGSMLSESEVGPSPSEVAAAIARDNRHRPQSEEGNNSALDGWSMDSSVEGLRSKLQRWRTELPPLYDRADNSSLRTTSGHIRRHTEGGEQEDGSGLFTCFGNICGIECHIVCGGGGGGCSSNPIPSRKKKSSIRPHHRSPSFDSHLS